MKPESPRLSLCVSLDQRVVATADLLGHLQVSLFIPSSDTRCASSTSDFALLDYLLIRGTEDELRPKIFLLRRMKLSGGLNHPSAQAMGEIGRVNPLIGPTADPIGDTKCHVAAVAGTAHEKSILAAIGPPGENILRRGLRLGIEGKDILFWVEAASFGGE